MPDRTGRGLYLHIPFCHQRCHFCAFYLEIHQARTAEEFLSSLLTEIRRYGDRRPFGPESLDSIYFGGGTPTTLSPQQLTTILSTAKDRFGLARDAEVTIEAHPESIALDGLSRLREGGFTRISFGVESMNQEELDLVGRPGTVLNNAGLTAAAREAGFTDINLDLMYGLPGQTTESWAVSLQRTIDLAPTHLSCYALMVEGGTRLQTAVQRGTVPAPDEDVQNEMEDLAEHLLDQAGYRRYEISNYCRPGFASRHNMLHWTGGQYLGLGPSAQSYVGGRRFGNVSNLTAYNRILRDGHLPVAESEQLTRAEDSCERLVFGLRMIDGVSPTETGALGFPGLTGRIDRLIEEHLLERNGDRIRLTARGRRYADSVGVALLTSLDHPPDRPPSP
jgi:oxygen-independent coproporphyrinogen-3 oxidase